MGMRIMTERRLCVQEIEHLFLFPLPNFMKLNRRVFVIVALVHAQPRINECIGTPDWHVCVNEAIFFRLDPSHHQRKKFIAKIQQQEQRPQLTIHTQYNTPPIQS